VQLLEPIVKSPEAAPEITTLNPASATLPEFVIFTVCAALDTPSAAPGNVTVVGLTLSAAGASPEPESGTCTGGTPRLVVATVTEPFWIPPAVGAKTTGAWHIPPGRMLVPQLPEPTLNGAVVANDSPCRIPVPELLTVSCIAALLFPIATAPKAS
jgi:hypothetical protein